MALYCTMQVTARNGADPVIGYLSARRVEGVAEPDSIGTYECEVSTADERWRGEIRHRYGDGGWVLVARLLQAAGLAPRQAVN